MLNKIPEELKLIISRKFEKDDWNLDRLLKEFQSKLEARERIAAVSNTPRATSSSIQNKRRAPFPTAAALLSPQEKKVQASKTGNSPREEVLNTASSDQQETSVIIANSQNHNTGALLPTFMLIRKLKFYYKLPGRVFLEQIIRTTK